MLIWGIDMLRRLSPGLFRGGHRTADPND